MNTNRHPRRQSYQCSSCGVRSLKWAGRCPSCGEWGAIEEAAPAAVGRPAAGGSRQPSVPAVPIKEVDASPVTPRPTGLAELDRVLGGGLVPGSVVLLAGEPGVGKSTLLLAAAHAWTSSNQGRALIISGEESAPQIRLRAGRLGALDDQLYLAAETDAAVAAGQVEAVGPNLLIVDSVQTLACAEVDGICGSVSQVRAVAQAMVALAKAHSMACVLVGHVTKDGAIAGPRQLEHLVDVVLHFEGDRSSDMRMLRGIKNRFGPADEVGCFRMSAAGIDPVTDPSEVFLSGRGRGLTGTSASVVLHGRRPLPVELQALVVPTGDGPSRRTLSGIDSARAAIVLAVLQRFGGLRLDRTDVLASTTGGIKAFDPALDLALAMAVWSTVRDIAMPPTLAVFGELGLSGEVRPVTGLAQRLAEAARLGFAHAIVPQIPGQELHIDGLQVVSVGDLNGAFRAMSTAQVRSLPNVRYLRSGVAAAGH